MKFPTTIAELKQIINEVWRATIESLRRLKNDNILWQDEGVDEGTSGEITTVNFTGTGVNATASGKILTVDISGGSVTIGQEEIDFGLPISEYNTSITVADTDILTTSKIMVTLALESTTDHRIEEVGIANLILSSGNIVDGVSFDINAYCPDGAIGKYKVNYTIEY